MSYQHDEHTTGGSGSNSNNIRNDTEYGNNSDNDKVSKVDCSGGSGTSGSGSGTGGSVEDDISDVLRWVTNGCHLVSIFLFGGIIFGWAPLKLVLMGEGQYSERCGDIVNVNDMNMSTANGVNYMNDVNVNVNDNDGTGYDIDIDIDIDNDTSSVCAEQMKCFNAIFTLAQFLLNFVSLPVGFFLDKASKPIYFSVAGICQVTGLVLFGISESKTPHRDYFVVSYGIMALGGCMAIIGAFPASFLVRPARFQPLILAASSCLFDASSVVFYLLYRTDLSFPHFVTRKRAFLGLAVLAFIVYTVLVLCWILLEKRHWKTVCHQEKEHNHRHECSIGNNDDNNCNNDDDDTRNDSHTPNKNNDSENMNSIRALHQKRIRSQRMHELSVPEQLLSFDFALIVVFASIHVLQCNLYIETVNEYLASIGDHDGMHAKIFSFVLPGGIVFIPFIDLTIRKVGAVNTLVITNVLSLIFGSVLLVPSLAVQTVNFGVFTCFRAYLYSTLNTYVAETFGVSTMGQIIGCTYTTGSIVTLLQYPAASIAEGYLGNQFGIVNLGVLALCLIPVGVTAWYSGVVLRNEGRAKRDGDGGGGGGGADGERVPLVGG